MNRMTKALHQNLIVTTVFTLFVAPAVFGDCNNSSNSDCKIGPSTGEMVSLIVGTVVALGGTTALVVTTTNQSKKKEAAYFEKNSELIAKHLGVGRGSSLEDLLKLYKIKPESKEQALRALQDDRLALITSVQDSKLSAYQKAASIEKKLAPYR